MKKCVRRGEKKNSGRNRFDVEVGKELGKTNMSPPDPEKGKIKSVVYFLALAKNDDIKLKSNGRLG